ncbi:MAG: hypothetical protein O2968_08095 [Acidobacteria bacterium]|nr:hypothetical protein [Acidobacteriota bacterium]
MRTNILAAICFGLAMLIVLPGLIALPALSADFTVEAAGAAPREGVPAAVAALLQADGVRVKGPDAKIVAELWGRKAAFEGNPAAGFGIRFDNIPEGVLIGLIRFPENRSDYREQHVPAGVYTLRYGLHPEDGDHMGVAPSRDFVLLTPAAADTEATKNYGFDDMVELSYKVGNSHPTVMRAALPEGDGALNIWQDDLEQWVVDLKVAGGAVGIIIYGHAEE